MLPSEIVQAIVAYAGPLDDPRIGWTGTTTSHPDMFKCERCGAEHLDCTKIEHKGGCSAKALLDVLAKLRPNVEVTGAARLHRAASVLTAGLCPGDDNGE